jgi:hypothetical protein
LHLKLNRPSVAQIAQPVTQRLLVHEGGDLGAQPLHPGQLRLDDVPELQHVQPGLHLDGTVVVLLDHPGDHDVSDPAVDAGLLGEPQHLARFLHRLLSTEVGVRGYELERDGVEGQEVAPHCTIVCSVRKVDDDRRGSDLICCNRD